MEGHEKKHSVDYVERLLIYRDMCADARGGKEKDTVKDKHNERRDVCMCSRKECVYRNKESERKKDGDGRE